MKDNQSADSKDREAIEPRGEAQGSELTEEELQAQGGEELPDREAMSLIDANVAAPVNVAAALNVLSDNSKAVAAAEQSNTITQHT
jgi:hypothetical protein